MLVFVFLAWFSYSKLNGNVYLSLSLSLSLSLCLPSSTAPRSAPPTP